MSPGSHGPAVERALLSSERKKLQAASGETQEVVAAACEWSVAKFSRIENGTSSVRKADLEALLRHYGVNEGRINELAQRAREAPETGPSIAHPAWSTNLHGSEKRCSAN